MDKKDTKRIEKARQMSNELSKKERNKWKIKNELKIKKRIEELQNEEIDKINNKLEELRKEYNRITRERGSAHKLAKIIEEQELQNISFNTRMQLMVKNRAKNTLNNFIKENTIKENENKINKEKEIMKRKHLMKSSLQKENVDKEDVNILRQIQKLENAENVLRHLIEKKKDLSHSESSIERNTEKLFWQKPLVSQQEFLNLSVGSHLNVQQSEVQIEVQNDSNVNQINKRRDTLIQTNKYENKVNSSEFNAISIAKQLYERLKSRKIINTGNNDSKNRKVYRNVAISTAQPLIPSEDNYIVINDNNDGSLPSSQTSYFSLPIPQTFSSNKAVNALSHLYKNQLLNKRSNSVSSKSSVSTIDLDSNSFKDSLDPLIVRINRLKELINKKVEENCEKDSVFDNPNDIRTDQLLSRGDCSKSGSKSQFMKRLSIIEESDNGIHNIHNSNDCIIDDENQLQNSRQLFSINDSFRDRINLSEKNEYREESSTSSNSFKTLHAITSSGLSSPFRDMSQTTDHQNSENCKTLSSLNLQELSSNVDFDSIDSSLFKSEPIRDRNAFWKDVFERAGIDINVNQIDNFLQTHNQIEMSLDSLSISAFAHSLHSHSTPK